MHRILLVEDSVAHQLVVRSALASPDIELVTAETLSAALTEIKRAHEYDLILLDLGLPDGEGMALLREVHARAISTRIPILLLTGKEDVDAKVTAFILGAEDYLVKPVDPTELRARVEMRLRKSRERSRGGDALERGVLTLNFALMQAFVNNDQGRPVAVEFTAKEFKIVSMLARHEDEVLSRLQLVEAVWGQNVNVVDRTVDSHICGARRKLGAAGRYIQSVTGTGYRFSIHAV